MNKEELKQQLDDELCEFCPWQQGEIEHPCNALCEGVYCDDALDTFIDENQGLFDDAE